MTTIKDRLRSAALDNALPIGAAWNLLSEAADEIERLERENTILKIKSDASLANNLCPDHRDKQNWKPCLACTVEKISNDLAKALEDAVRHGFLAGQDWAEVYTSWFEPKDKETESKIQDAIRALKEKP